VNLRGKRRQQTVSRHRQEDARLRHHHHQHDRRQPGQRSKRDENAEHRHRSGPRAAGRASFSRLDGDSVRAGQVLRARSATARSSTSRRTWCSVSLKFARTKSSPSVRVRSKEFLAQ